MSAETQSREDFKPGVVWEGRGYRVVVVLDDETARPTAEVERWQGTDAMGVHRWAPIDYRSSQDALCDALWRVVPGLLMLDKVES